MGKNYNLKGYMIFSFLIYLLLALTNEYLNIQEGFLIGFSDSVSYLKIIEAAPSFHNDPIAPQQGYRFIIPYFIGTLLYLTNIDDCLKVCQNVDYIFHAAGMVSAARMTVNNPMTAISTNLVVTLKTLEVAMNNKNGK